VASRFQAMITGTTMLHLHFANRLETLRSQLLAQAHATPRGVFEPLQVLVPSLGLRRHLMLAFAAHDGLCANVRFEFLAQWLWAQPQRSGADVPATPPLAPARLAWRVLAAFEDETFIAPHPRLASWLRAADPVMRLELAQRSAALIEQYATYRADWLVRWSARQWAKDTAPLSADEAWQAALWRRLLAERAMAEPLHVLAALQAEYPAVVPGLPAAIHVFALPTMPPLHLQLLQGWAERTEIHIYALNPCREYWYDPGPRRHGAPLAEGAHPLLVGWGTQTRQQLEQLVAATGDGALDDGHYTPHGEPTWLGRLHDSLLDSEVPAPGAWASGNGNRGGDSDSDRSIELHVCHSLTRQIEVLHDRLLGLFAADPALRADEVLVVVPDLEQAAPLIDAIFGSAPQSRALPYAVTGRPGSQINSVAKAFVGLLGLAGSRALAGEVYALLQQPPIARRFGLDSAALDLLRSAIDQAGVRWGLDAAHRGELGLPATALNTWADGMQRVLLGHLVADSDTPEPFAGLLPAAGLEGSAAACLGGLHGFVRALAALHESLASPLPAAAWREQLAACIDTFIDPAGDEREELRALHAALHDTCTAIDDGGAALRIPLPVLQAALVQRLDDPAHGGVPGGAITFSSMSSLRGLPYAWVCVLGLDDDGFPSKAQPDEFDLIALDPRAGDRQRRSDERALFLDLLLAARTGLYLSHTGRSIRDNAALPPSVLVAELIDFLAAAAGAGADRSRWIVEHPLQPFSAAAFAVDGDPRIRSHHAEMAAALLHGLRAAAGETAGAVAMPTDEAGANETDADAADGGDAADDSDTPTRFEPLPPRFFDAPLPAPAEAERRIDLPRLIAFFAHPARALLRGRLGLEWAQDRSELEDTEPLLPDPRTRRALAERLLPPLLVNDPAHDLQALAAAGNDWPDGSIGAPALAVLLDDLRNFAAGLRSHHLAPVLPPASVGLPCDIDGLRWSMHATLTDVRSTGLLRWRFEPLDGRGLLAAWIEHLALCLASEQGVVAARPHTALHRVDGCWTLRPVADPAEQLSTLIRLYAQGQREPLPLPAWATWAFVQKLRENKPEAACLTAARNAWRGTPSPPIRGEADDPAWRLALRGAPEPIDAAFAAIATAVFAPILDHLDEPD